MSKPDPDPSQPLHLPREEAFAQLCATDELIGDAFTKAGYKSKASTHASNASRLAARPRVAARIAYIRSKAAERAEITITDIVDQLDADRTFARQEGNPSAAVAATMGKAKILGFVRDKLEHTGKDGKPISVETKEAMSPEEKRNFIVDRLLEAMEKSGVKPNAPGSQTQQ